MNNELTVTVDKTYTLGRRFILNGRITATSANILQHKLEEAFREKHPRFILNMQQVSFLSSGGIRVLLMFCKKAKANGAGFFVEAPSENVVNVLGMVALDEMLLK